MHHKPKNLVILKLGGSAITEKAKGFLKAKTGILKRISKQLKFFLKKNPGVSLIIVHGAGSFGHKTVAQYKIRDGVRTKEHLRGWCVTRQKMAELNTFVMNALLSESIPAISLQPSASLIQSGKKIVSFPTVAVKGFLSLGVVPVFYGDFVLDKKLGGSVVSGDAIVSFLAKKLSAKKVLFGGNFEGILLNRKVVEKIDCENISEVLKHAGKSNALDVTGGMKGKLLELKKINGVQITVFDVTKKDNLLLALNNGKIGSKIFFSNKKTC
jgi:isopentenyl phosphate kinase